MRLPQSGVLTSWGGSWLGAPSSWLPEGLLAWQAQRWGQWSWGPVVELEVGLASSPSSLCVMRCKEIRPGGGAQPTTSGCEPGCIARKAKWVVDPIITPGSWNVSEATGLLLPKGRSRRCVSSKKMAHLRVLENRGELALCSPSPACGGGPLRVLQHVHMWKPHCSTENSSQTLFFSIC